MRVTQRVALIFFISCSCTAGDGSGSSCNSSATLPLAAGASRGSKCGRFNNFVELSTHTLILRHSGRHECGRRIAGVVRKHSGFQFARMEGDMKEKCLCTKMPFCAQSLPQSETLCTKGVFCAQSRVAQEQSRGRTGTK